MPLVPGQAAPPLTVPTLDGKYWVLGKSHVAGTLIFFHSGLSCQISKACVIDLQRRRKEFEDLNVETIAISSDTEVAASAFAECHGIDTLPLGYNLATETAIAWGLYLSETTLPEEQRIYNELGLFLVRRDGLIHVATTASFPIWRPDLDAALAQFADLEDRRLPTYRTTFVPVVIPEREELSFCNGRGAPPVWRRSDK